MQNPSDTESAAAFYDARRKWLDLVCGCPDVHHATFRVGYWLARRMNGDDQCTWWTVPKIAAQIGCSERTVFKAISELESLNLLVVVRKPGKGSTYFIRLPFDDTPAKNAGLPLQKMQPNIES